MAQDHEMLRRAAVQCMANLMLSDEVCVSQIKLVFEFYISLNNFKIYKIERMKSQHLKKKKRF